MEKKTPIFLAEKVNIVKFLIFVTVFALTFIFIYEPFNGEKLWQKLIGKEHASLYMSFLIAIGFVVLIISRLLLYKAQKSLQSVMFLHSMDDRNKFHYTDMYTYSLEINTQNTNFLLYYLVHSIIPYPYYLFLILFLVVFFSQRK